MSGIHWNCPHCKKDIIITSERYSRSFHRLAIDNNDGKHCIETEYFVCTNPDCKKYTLVANLYEETIYNSTYNHFEPKGFPKKSYNLVPSSKSKSFPNYIPSVLTNDYYEACEIKDLSPKASATLSRRCLQGIIRDFWSISKNTLYEEIQAIKGEVDEVTWSAIDSVRKIGNIGAHMEKDINLIIEVDPDEANLLIELIETLFEDWYISRYEREQRMSKITALSKEKDIIRHQKNS